jgi:hypothetical protein
MTLHAKSYVELAREKDMRQLHCFGIKLTHYAADSARQSDPDFVLDVLAA